MSVGTPLQPFPLKPWRAAPLRFVPLDARRLRQLSGRHEVAMGDPEQTETTMATLLGVFAKIGSGFSGRVQTMAFTAQIDLTPNEGALGRQPHFRVYHGAREIGAAWLKRSRSETEYLSLKITDLAFGGAPVYPILVKSERSPASWNLLLSGRGR
jgi:uncharacterized protein (DUF736 family)